MDLVKETYLSSLRQIQPLDEVEQEHIADALSWISKTSELCKPENMEKHACAISVILSQDRKKTFLIDHIKAGIWLPPGGHVEKGKTFIDTIKNETKEELGVELEFIKENPFFLSQTKAKDKSGIHTDVTAWFLVEGDENSNYSVLEKEAREGKWFSIEEILTNQVFSFLHRPFRKVNEMVT